MPGMGVIWGKSKQRSAHAEHRGGGNHSIRFQGAQYIEKNPKWIAGVQVERGEDSLQMGKGAGLEISPTI